jgi:hypothetical protein
MIQQIPRQDRASPFAAAIRSPGSETRLYFNGVQSNLIVPAGSKHFEIETLEHLEPSLAAGRLRRHAVVGCACDMSGPNLLELAVSSYSKD